MKDVLLAIETATSICSVAVLRGAELFAEISESATQRHSERLPALVAQAVGEAGLQLTGIKYVAVSLGPGSFTGLRVGMAYSKGLCMAIGATLLPVPTLDALAHNILQEKLEPIDKATTAGDVFICPMTVARKGEAFGKLFQYRDGALEALREPFLINGENFEEILRDYGDFKPNRSLTLCAGEGSEQFKELCHGLSGISVLSGISASSVSVGTLGAIAVHEIIANPLPLGEIAPMYLKEFTVKQRV